MIFALFFLTHYLIVLQNVKTFIQNVIKMQDDNWMPLTEWWVSCDEWSKIMWQQFSVEIPITSLDVCLSDFDWHSMDSLWNFTFNSVVFHFPTKVFQH